MTIKINSADDAGWAEQLPFVGSSRFGLWTSDDVDKASRSVKSAERTLALFELYSLVQRPLLVGEISKKLGIPQPSVTMLVRNLTKLGYLEHDRFSRTYVPTIRIMLLGSWLNRRMNREGGLESHLDRLLSVIDETVVVGIENGVFSQYVSAQLPDAPSRMKVQSGLLRPITRTGIGRVLLSRMTNEEIDRIVRRCNAEVGPEHRVCVDAFMRLIADIREKGYAETDGDMTPGYGVIAVAVDAPAGKIPIAVGVGAPLDRLRAKRELIISELKEVKSRLGLAA